MRLCVKRAHKPARLGRNCLVTPTVGAGASSSNYFCPFYQLQHRYRRRHFAHREATMDIRQRQRGLLAAIWQVDKNRRRDD
jgi:hypothetical protein